MTDKQSAIDAAARMSTSEPWTVSELAREANVGYQMARHAKDVLERRGLIKFCGRASGQGAPDLYVFVPAKPRQTVEERVTVLENRLTEYDRAFALLGKGGASGLVLAG